ncbi:MAG: hypothetical protein ACI9DC_002980 [Gammaproteobacteria bacterium]|jgi:hypothetical protein
MNVRLSDGTPIESGTAFSLFQADSFLTIGSVIAKVPDWPPSSKGSKSPVA